MASYDRRKTFEFRMSKKVAELTQVVHMLFTRNHEKEVEIETLRSAYEEEIEKVIRDARSRLVASERSADQINARVNEETDKVRRQYEAEMQLRQQEMDRRIKDLERQVQEERSESQHLKDMLLSSQKGLEVARASLTSEQLARDQEAVNRLAELTAQQKRTSQLERNLRDAEAIHNEAIHDLESANAKLQKDVLRLQELAEQSRKAREALVARNKALEQEIKGLKREVSRRMSEFSSRSQPLQQSSAVRKVNMPPTPEESVDMEAIGDTTEVDLLKRELLRYKMELSNRDQNFNRIFSDHQPMIIDTRVHRPTLGLMNSSSARDQLISSFTSQRPGNRGTIQREKTFSYVVSQAYEEEPMQVARCRSSVTDSRPSSCHRFPNVDAISTRTTRLARPRPPAKEELLMNKSMV